MKQYNQFLDEDQNNQDLPAKQNKNISGIIIKIILVLVLLAIITFSIIYNQEILNFYQEFIKWLQDHQYVGFFCLIGAYAIGTVCFFPGLLLTLGAGFCYNEVMDNQFLAVMVGSLAVFLGAQLGTLLSLILAKYVFRDIVKEKTQNNVYFSAIDKAIETQSLKIVFLLRLAPIVPYNLFNYFMGITAVQIKEYLLGGFGMIPAILLYVYFGTTLQTFSDLAQGNFNKGPYYIIFLIVGIVAGIAGIVYIGIVAKKEVNKILDTEKLQQEQQSNSKKNSNIDMQNMKI